MPFYGLNLSPKCGTKCLNGYNGPNFESNYAQDPWQLNKKCKLISGLLVATLSSGVIDSRRFEETYRNHLQVLIHPTFRWAQEKDKVKLSQYMPLTHTGWMEVELHVFLILALYWGEWLASLVGRFIPGLGPPYPSKRKTNWSVSRAVWSQWRREKSRSFSRNATTVPRSVLLVA